MPDPSQMTAQIARASRQTAMTFAVLLFLQQAPLAQAESGNAPARATPATSSAPAAALPAPTLIQRAIAEKRRILSSHFPGHVSRSVDDALRARFANIHLPRSVMGA